MANNTSKLNIDGTTYDLIDATAVHTVDSALSSSSVNPVQNKIIKAELDKKLTVLDLGEKTLTSNGGAYTFTVTSANITALAASHDAVKFYVAATSSYRPADTIVALKSGISTVNGVSCNIYSGTLGEALLESNTFTLAVPTATTGNGYYKEDSDADIDIDALLDSLLNNDNGIADKQVFLNRATNYGDKTRMEPTLIGATMAWNQMFKAKNSETYHGLTYTKLDDNHFSVTGTVTEAISYDQYPLGVVSQQFNRGEHVYFLETQNIPYNVSISGFSIPSYNPAVFKLTGTGSWSGAPKVNTPLGTQITITNGHVDLCDLTIALGPTIADYAYSLEQSTAGSGIAWLKSHGFLTKDYYPYDAGSLQSVKPSASRTGGYTKINTNSDLIGRSDGTHSYDSTTDTVTFSATIPSVNYCYWGNGTWRPPKQHICFMSARFTGTGFTGVWLKPYNSPTTPTTYPAYSGDGVYSAIQKSPAGDASITTIVGISGTNGTSATGTISQIILTDLTADLGETLANQIYALEQANTGAGINRLKEIGYFDPHTYPISQTELRGIYKLDSSNNLYAYGDIRYSDGAVTRKYGIVDLGTLDWSYDTSGTYPLFYSSGIDSLAKTVSYTITYICGKYASLESNSRSTMRSIATDKIVMITGVGTLGTVCIRDTAYSDPATFKTAMSGVYLVYELATPTTEQADPFQSPQVIYDGGTQTYIDTRDVPVPVCQEAEYLTESRSDLQQVFDAPTEDGKYKFTSSVVGGTPSYNWEEDVEAADHSSYYGTATGGTNVGLTTNIPGFSLYTGVRLVVKVTNATTFSTGIGLSVFDGATTYPSKMLKYAGAIVTSLNANTAYELVYDGTDYVIVGERELGILHSANCNTAASTAAKVATTYNRVQVHLIPGFRALVHFAQGNTANNITLNLDDTGAIEVRLLSSIYSNTGFTFAAGTFVEFYYSGAYWFAISITPSQTKIDAGNVVSGTLASARMPTGYMKEEYLAWGGQNIISDVSPVGAAMSAEHSANRIAYVNNDAVDVEYSSDSGSTWFDSGLTSSQKTALTTGTTTINIPVGRSMSDTTSAFTTMSRLRITLSASKDADHVNYFYTNPKKCLINVNTAVHLNAMIEYRTGVNALIDGSWTTFGTYLVSGWSGWNDIPLILSSLGGSSTQTSNIWQVRFTFAPTTTSSSSPAHCNVRGIRIFGTNAWVSPSFLAAKGHLYSYDADKNATFPNQVTGTAFHGQGAMQYYGSCATANNDNVKVVTCTGFTLTSGVRISVTFTNGSISASTMYLNVNGTGSKAVKYIIDNGSLEMSCRCDAGTTLEFVYTGSYYLLVTPYSLRNAGTQAARLTSANRAYSNYGLEYFLATSSMTTGKPPADSHIIGMHWDNQNSYTTQLAVGHGSAMTESGRMWSRGQYDANGTWSTWKEVARLTSDPTAGQIMVSDQVTGYGLIKGVDTITSTSVTATVMQATQITNGDYLVFADQSDNGKLKVGSYPFGVETTKFLRNDGTWAVPPSGVTESSGTFTLSDSSTQYSISASYYKVGKQVTIYGYFPTPGTSTPSVSSLTGLPFSPISSTEIMIPQYVTGQLSYALFKIGLTSGTNSVSTWGYMVGSSSFNSSWVNYAYRGVINFTITYLTND